MGTERFCGFVWSFAKCQKWKSENFFFFSKELNTSHGVQGWGPLDSCFVLSYKTQEIMKTYSLNKLIIFWNNQLNCTFRDILRVLDIIDDDSPDDGKLDKILQVLRKAGLEEDGYQNHFHKLMEQDFKKEIERRGKFKMEVLRDRNLIVPIDVFQLDLLNAQRIKILIILN